MRKKQAPLGTVVRALLGAVLLMLLAGCSRPPDSAAQPASSPTPTRSATATATAIPTTEPAAPPAALPTATVAPLPTANRTPLPPFTWPCCYDYFFTPPPARCPRSPPVSSAAAEQPFDGGLMIWLEATDSIYLFYPEGQWQRFDDTWSEEKAESDPALTPPAERYQPIRGFGKVWREHEGVREQLGWATSPELGFRSQLQQPVADGPEETDQVLYLRTFNGQVYYLIEREPDRGEWGLAASW